jgi:hypothetical protein
LVFAEKIAEKTWSKIKDTKHVDLGGSSSPTYSVHSDKPYYHVKPATTMKSSSKYQGEDQYMPPPQNLDDVLTPI